MIKRLLSSRWFIKLLALTGLIHMLMTKGWKHTLILWALFIVITFIGVWVINLVEGKEHNRD